MKIRLESLSHQIDCLKAIENVFKDVVIKKDTNNDTYNISNPIFDVNDKQLLTNIDNIWSGNVGDLQPIPELLKNRVNDDILGIDLKLETGTGKTYCYTRLMYHLHQKYGFHKFIILVPSVAIKEGVKSFIESDYSQRHFKDIYSLNSNLRNINLELNILDSVKSNKNIPSSVYNFYIKNVLENNKISCLLMTSGMLISNKTMSREYGFIASPYELLKSTRPIVIIDEPHKFKRNNKAYKCLLEKIKPLAVIRFGATFPMDDKSERIDYNNLIYNLNSAQAFNKGLIKGVITQNIVNTDKDVVKIKLISIDQKNKKVSFRNENTKKSYELGLGDSLGNLHYDLKGIYIEDIGKNNSDYIKNGVTLSNGHIIAVGDIIFSNIYGKSYQELMIKQAIDNHFRIEKENFFPDFGNKIKTLSLFFIDSIFSYRGDNNDGHLRIYFEESLKVKLEEEISNLESKKSHINDREKEYLEYLNASYRDIKKTNGGYFSEDNFTLDSNIEKEVHQILSDKEKLLSFKDKDNNWNTMRFIFSKWTLREGWDNPNVFQIVKLRSSGSEISKLQEVGRGLRLPVDEFGNRVSSNQFYLTYLIDFTENDFAEKLISEIKSDNILVLTDNIIKSISNIYGLDKKYIRDNLSKLGYINNDGEINLNRINDLYNLYPNLVEDKDIYDNLLQNNKIIDSNVAKPDIKVKINKENFNELKDIWNKLNRKYYLMFGNIDKEELIDDLYNIIKKVGHKTSNIEVIQKKVSHNEYLKEEIIASHKFEDRIKYGEFLKNLNSVTSFSFDVIHEALIRYYKKYKFDDSFFNKSTLSHLIHEFYNWSEEKFETRYSYKAIDIKVTRTQLTDEFGNPKDSICQASVGKYKCNSSSSETPKRFLYEDVIYDSEKERENILSSNNINKIIVFGKIPKSSIKIPLYFGGTTSPDFIYVIKKDDSTTINCIIETKGVEKESSLRHEEKLKISAAKKFFDFLASEGINVKFEAQIQKDNIKDIIDDLIK